MPKITSQNIQQLAMSTIRTFLIGAGGSVPVPPATDLSLADLELAYMGNNTTGGSNKIVTISNLCMWQQAEVYGGAITSYTPSSNPKPWNYNGPGPSAYKPAAISEFQQAYYPLPNASFTGQATGQKNSNGNIVGTFGGGARANAIGSSYWFFVDTGFRLNGAVNVGSWYNAGASYTITNVLNGSGFTGWVVDDRLCGGQMLESNEIRILGTKTYP